jgi:hypothetical protein
MQTVFSTTCSGWYYKHITIVMTIIKVATLKRVLFRSSLTLNALYDTCEPFYRLFMSVNYSHNKIC